MTQITVTDNVCWMCGKGFVGDNKQGQRTTHHVIPQYLRPHKNILIPLHKACHEKLNEQDFGALVSFTYSIMKSAQSLLGNTNKILCRLKKMETRTVEDVVELKK